MTAVAIYHPSGTAQAGRHSALRIASAAIGHPSWGQTYPMRYLGGGDRSFCYQPLFKRIRRRFAVYPPWAWGKNIKSCCDAFKKAVPDSRDTAGRDVQLF